MIILKDRTKRYNKSSINHITLKLTSKYDSIYLSHKKGDKIYNLIDLFKFKTSTYPYDVYSELFGKHNVSIKEIINTNDRFIVKDNNIYTKPYINVCINNGEIITYYFDNDKEAIEKYEEYTKELLGSDYYQVN